MRSHIALLVALIILSGMGLAGCLEVPADEDSQDPGSDGPQPRDPARDRDRPTGNETEEDKDCWEYSPPRAAPPEEHEVGSVDEIRCAGQYTVRNEGSGESWSVPTWEVGDYWVYELEVMGQCVQQKLTVGDTGVLLNMSVYELDMEGMDCDGEPSGRPSSETRTQDDLNKIQQNGYIEYHALFPLREGKSWVYMNTGGHLIEIDSVAFDPNYHHSGISLVEAWHVEWTVSNMGTEVRYKQTWGEGVKNLLRQEIEYDTLTIVQKLVESNYLDDDDLPV